MVPKRSILIITTAANLGGAEIALSNILCGIRDDFCIEVISLTGGGVIADKIKSYGIVVHELNFKKVSRLHSELRQFVAIILKFKPDVIQGWMYHGNLFAALAKLFSPKKAKLYLGIRQSLQDIAGEKRGTRMVIYADSKCSAAAAAIVYNSYAGKIDHENYGYAKNKGTVIYNGYDMDVFQPAKENHQLLCAELKIPPTSFLIGLVARYHPVKDHATFIHAAGMVVNQYPHIHFILVGEGINPNNTDLQKLIHLYPNLMERTHLLGLRQDIPYITSALNIATNCSLSEGLANSVCEALACGVLCVATDVGDSSKIIGKYGMIIPIQSPPELAKAWQKIIEMPVAEHEQLSFSARQQIMKQCSAQNMIEQYKTLYGEI